MILGLHKTTRTHNDIYGLTNEIWNAKWNGIATQSQYDGDKDEVVTLRDFTQAGKVVDLRAALFAGNARIEVGVDGSLRELRSEKPWTIKKGTLVAVWKK